MLIPIKDFVLRRTYIFMDKNYMQFGLFLSFDISAASVHDIHYLQDIKLQMSDCVLLGDKGYLSQTIQLDLFNEVNIELETPKRKNHKDYKPQF